MKHTFILLLFLFSFSFSSTLTAQPETGEKTEASKQAEENNEALQGVAESIVDTERLDSIEQVFNARFEAIEAEGKTTYEEVKGAAKPFDTREEFDYFLLWILGMLTTALTKFQEKFEWAKKIDRSIVIVIGTAAVLVLAFTLLRGEFNPLTYLTDWIFTGGGSVLFFEIFVKKKKEEEPEALKVSL